MMMMLTKKKKQKKIQLKISKEIQLEISQTRANLKNLKAKYKILRKTCLKLTILKL